MKARFSGGIFLSAVVVACSAWLMYYSTGAVARAADKILQREAAGGRFTGVVLISRGGNVLFEKAYGLANREWEVANTPTTKFRIGSITKTFTATLIMQLEREKRLALTDPLCSYMEECPAGWSAVTLHHLLSHTSGIYNYTRSSDHAALRSAPQTREQVLARFTKIAPDFAPGEKFQYSNSNFFLLGIVIEKITGQPYETVLRARILDPLGMRDTGIAKFETILPSRASGYRPGREGRPVNDLHMDDTWSFSAGAMYSTVRDLERYSEALDSGTPLPRESLERMWKPVTESYGYGWQTQVSKQTFNRRVVEHGGHVPGFIALLRRFVDERITLIVLSNNDGSNAQIVNSLSAVALGIPYTPTTDRKSVRLAPEALRRYAGDYEINGSIWTLEERGGLLFGRSETGSEVELKTDADGTLFIEGMEGSLSPVENRQGEVTGLLALFGAYTHIAQKVR
jgi:CubicO group peptidase (beta-lactamase class C family)